jgi:hypothetical protein
MTVLEDPALNQRSLKAPYPAYIALWCSIIRLTAITHWLL